jgi:hypothetical protein
LYLSTKKSFLALLVATTFLTGCQETSNSTNDSLEVEATIPSDSTISSESQFDSAPEASLVAKFEGQVKDSVTGEGIENVQVSVGDAVTTTDANGNYALFDVNTTTRAVVTFEHQGYFHNSAVIQADEFAEETDILSSNYLEYELAPNEQQAPFDSQANTVVNLANSASIALSAAVYNDLSGNEYIGEIVPDVAYLDPTTDSGKATFPGLFEGKDNSGNIALFGSYGLITATLKDVEGNTLSLADGAVATLTFPSIASLKEENIIPLWYYDYNQGIWIEEGYAELQSDGTYQGSVSHLGTWSLNMPIENAPGIYRGRIIYADGITVKDSRVTAVGPNWVRSDLSTDADGIFEIGVLPGDDFKLVAYNYKWKYEAAHNEIIPAVASGDIIEDRM